MGTHDQAPDRCVLPAGFWERVGSARRRLLVLDYDGTLVSFCVRRLEARVPPETIEMLGRVRAQCATEVILVSGRPVREMEDLLGPAPLHLIGENGWDERTPEGRYVLHPLPSSTAVQLSRACRAARAAGMGEWLERKRCSVMLHTRGLPKEEVRWLEASAERVWGNLFQRDGLRLARLDGGLELQAAARNKGNVVAALVAAGGPGVLPVYLGDDGADEDAFREVLGVGLAVRVGSEERPSLAEGWLCSCGGVARFLERWSQEARGEHGG